MTALTDTQKKSRALYIGHLTEIHRKANLSDTTEREPWQKVNDSHVHCTAIEAIARDMMTADEYQAWLDNL